MEGWQFTLLLVFSYWAVDRICQTIAFVVTHQRLPAYVPMPAPQNMYQAPSS
jgi:hypothetical protein